MEVATDFISTELVPQPLMRRANEGSSHTLHTHLPSPFAQTHLPGEMKDKKLMEQRGPGPHLPLRSGGAETPNTWQDPAQKHHQTDT